MLQCLKMKMEVDMIKTYYIGDLEIKGRLKHLMDLCIEIRLLAAESGRDLSNNINDFCFSVYKDYQDFYGCSDDDMDYIIEKAI